MGAKKFDKAGGASEKPQIQEKKESLLTRVRRFLVASDLDLETYRRLEGIPHEERKVFCRSRWGL